MFRALLPKIHKRVDNEIDTAERMLLDVEAHLENNLAERDKLKARLARLCKYRDDHDVTL